MEASYRLLPAAMGSSLGLSVLPGLLPAACIQALTFALLSALPGLPLIEVESPD